MCGGSSTTTQSVQIPQQVLDRYTSVNNQAQQAASQPFQVYSTDPSAFVAPLNSEENTGIANTNTAAGSAQPYYNTAQWAFDQAGVGSAPFLDAAATGVGAAQQTGSNYAGLAQGQLAAANENATPLNNSAEGYYTSAYAGAQPYNYAAGSQISQGLAAAQPLNATASQGYNTALSGAQGYNTAATGLAAAGAGAVNAQPLNINRYLSPYLSDVASSEAALLNQQNQQAQSGQLGAAIQSGAFGGDRAGIAAANLAQQQQLSNANILSGILNTGYNTALSTAQQQQGVNLSASQANRSAVQNAATQLESIGQQGYQQGTGTAAQQAALGQQEYAQGLGAGSALQSLGNQVYSQGAGTGQNQASLGQQVFGQGLSTSQQEAALGQQQFEQQLAASQENAALGSQIYNQASTTGTNLENLGTSAQTAGLQGAQAQIAAGQLGQQTTQAGNTALYNQFLQQQSYPFQVAQFLANIAEGTGALSGSTTTTTQPGGFFSDRRLKTDIAKIGETFDGQPIYSFKYKGDPRTQIGLMAQDVEKTHPDAVGLAAGFKTVDYGKATKDAAGRGKFAAGGLARDGYAYGGYPMLPGISPYDIQALLQSQGAGPYANAGLYGASSGSPRGGSSYVPQANLPVSHLAVAGDIPKQPSMMEQIHSAAQTGDDIAKGVAGAQAAWRKVHPPQKPAPSPDSAPPSGGGSDTVSTSGSDTVAGGDGSDKLLSDNDDDAPPFARGGLAGYADGGMPYDDQGDGQGMDIPDQQPNVHSLQTPGAPGSSGSSGMSNAKDAAETALDVAKLAAMFMNRGGRAGYADGGMPDDSDDTILSGDNDNQGLAGGAGKDTIIPASPKVVSRAPARPFGTIDRDTDNSTFWNPWGPKDPPNIDLTPSGLARMGINTLTAPFGTAAEAAEVGGGRSRQPVPQADPAKLAAIMAPPAAKPQAASRQPSSAPSAHGLAAGSAAAPPRAALDTSNLTQPEPVQAFGDLQKVQPASGAGLVPSAEAADDAKTAMDYDSGLAGALHHAESAVGSSPVGGYFKDLGKGDLPSWISLLSALGAAGTAPTVHPGVALAAALSGGAHGYMQAKQQQAETGLTQGEAKEQQYEAEAAGTWGRQSVQNHAPPGMIVQPGVGPSGEYVLGPDGQKYHYVPAASAISGAGAPASAPGGVSAAGASAPHGFLSPSADTDAEMQKAYHINPGANGATNQALAFSLSPQAKPLDDAARTNWTNATNNLPQMDTSQRQIIQLAQSINELSHGSLTGQGHGSEYRTRLTNIAATGAQMLGMPLPSDWSKDLTNQQIITKIKTLMGPAIAQQNDEKAAAIARAITGVLPGGDLTTDAADELLSQMLIQPQKARDLYNYGNEYSSRYGVMAGVDAGFQRDVAPRYGVEQGQIKKFIGSNAFPRAMADLQSTDPKVRDRAIRGLDAIGGSGFHRYFTLGQ